MMKITIEAAFDDPLKAAVFFSHMTTCSRELGSDKPAEKLASAPVAKLAPAPVREEPALPASAPAHVETPLIEGPMPGAPKKRGPGRPSNAEKEAREAAAQKSNSLARMQTAVATAEPLPEKSEPRPEAASVADAPAPAPVGELSFDDLQTFARDAMVKRLVDPNDTRKLLDDFGAAGLSTIPPSRRAEFLERFKGIMKKAA